MKLEYTCKGGVRKMKIFNQYLIIKQKNSFVACIQNEKESNMKAETHWMIKQKKISKKKQLVNQMYTI